MTILVLTTTPPPAMMFDDTYAQTFDLPFLYKAKAVVESLYEADKGLRRVHAPLVDDLFAGEVLV